MVREIGDNKLWLDNYEVGWRTAFSAHEEIRAGRHVNDFYTYPNQNPPITNHTIAGAYSKEERMRFANPSPFGGFPFAEFRLLDASGFIDYGIDGTEGDDYEVYDYDFIICESGSFKWMSNDKNQTESLLSIFKLYPNPTAGSFIIQSSVSHESIEKVVVLDLTGKEVFSSSGNNKDHQIEIQLSNEIAKGIYLVRIKTESKTETLKLIKQ